MKKKKGIIKRYETSGGVIATEDPPLLAFVDKAYMRKNFQGESPLWDKEDSGILAGPVEAHYAVTDYCDMGCPGCYMSASPDGARGVDPARDLERAKEIADRLVEMKIFHLALGGGESFLLPWFFELAEYFRSRGIVPNVTTSGMALSEEAVGQCTVFGQVNVSIDGIGPEYKLTRPGGDFAVVERALTLLIKEGIRAGINTVISRKNFDALESIVKYVKKKGAQDIEFLRYKPTGRGRDHYQETALTPDQGIALLPKMKRLSRKYRISLKLDCSFTPFVCWHRPSKRVLEYFSILGCDAGNWLIGVSPAGGVSPCSFITDRDIPVEELKERWPREETFSEFRYTDGLKDTPCGKCDYLTICKGGCSAVSYFLTGSFVGPDPECPFIVRGAIREVP